MRDVYRKEALRKLTSPEQLDQLTSIVSSRGWVALLASFALIVIASMWFIFGEVPITVGGEGILIGLGALHRVTISETGTIQDLSVKGRGYVVKDQVLARVRRISSDANDCFEIKSPASGKLLSLSFKINDFVKQGDTMGVIESESTNINALVFISLDDGKLIHPGMEIQISPSSANQQEYGFIYGNVNQVTDFPMTKETLMQFLQNEALVDLYLSGGPKIGVYATLERDNTTASGYKWSSGKGPDAEINCATPCSATIVLKRVTPISLIF